MQFALPTLSAVLAVVAAAVTFTTLLALGYWVYRDASLRGSDSSVLWGIGCVVVSPLTLVYLLLRGRIGERTEPRSRVETACLTIVVGVVLSQAAAAVLTPPDAYSMLYFFAPSLLVTLPAAYLYLEGVPSRLRPTA